MPRQTSLFMLAALLCALAGCGSGETAYRYRMTVYIETPSGVVKSGSSVIEVASRNAANLDSLIRAGNCGNRSSVPMTQTVSGQAAEIDLGGDHVVYALLQSRSGIGAEDFPAAAFRNELNLPDCPDWVDEQRRVKILQGHSAPAVLENRPRRNDGQTTVFPILARFSDPLDRRTLRVLDPHNLAGELGPGYRLLLVTIQITDDPLPPVTERGVRQRLRWLETYKGSIDPYATPGDVAEPGRVLTDLAFRAPAP